jgi:nucleotide-binding universal stress UspA family protein
MRWLVGIDLHARSHGAVSTAAWLRAHLRVDPSQAPPEFVGVHVVDERFRESAKVMGALRRAGEEALARAAALGGDAELFRSLEVVMAPSAEDGLQQAAAEFGADAMILGRIAPRGGHELVRLGSVARRMLRRLPVPILIVPPDLERAAIAAGPVLLATDLAPDAAVAAGVAFRLARELGRPIVASHVDSLPDTNQSLLDEIWVQPPVTLRRTRADVEQWCAAQGIVPAQTLLSHGAVVDDLLEHARRVDACMIVCGSRRLAMLDRVFTSSVGTDLSRVTDRPVLLVPGGSPVGPAATP